MGSSLLYNGQLMGRLKLDLRRHLPMLFCTFVDPHGIHFGSDTRKPESYLKVWSLGGTVTSVPEQ
jgi:hypothetical protein